MTWLPPQGKQLRSIGQSNRRINIWHGAVRSSKTVGANFRWLKLIAYLQANQIPGDLVMWGKTERTLKRNILDEFEEFLPKGAYHFNRGSGEVYIWGRKIDVVGANDERASDKIRGATYLAAYGDELTLTPESFFVMMLSRLSLPNAQLFGTTNPDGPYHWLKKGYLDNDELDLAQFQFMLEDNPHLPEDYVRELKKEYTGLWYKRFILGLWVQAAGAIYDMWSDDVVKPLDEDEVRRLGGAKWGRFVDVDYGTSNPCTFSMKRHWTIDGQVHVHTESEYWYDGRERGRQMTDEQYCDALADFLEGYPGRIPVYVDPSAASFIAAGKQRGFKMIEADNSVIDGIRFVSSLLSSGRYTVDPGCKHTIRNYQSYVWDEKAQARGEDKPVKDNDHACDRDRYGIYTRFGGEKRTKYGAHANM